MAAGALVLVAAVVAVVRSDVPTSVHFEQVSSLAWLGFEATGTVELFDGSVPSQAGLASVKVAEPGTPIQVLQRGDGDALVVAGEGDAFVALDGRTRTASEPLRPFAPPGPTPAAPDAGGALRLYGRSQGPIWAVQGGQARQLDDEALVGSADAFPLRPGVGAEIVPGERGSLWALDDEGLLSIAENRIAATVDGPADLGRVGGAVILLEPGSGTLRLPTRGRACRLDVSGGARVHETETTILVTDPDRGHALLLTPECRLVREVLLPKEIDVGQVAEAGGWLYAVDRATLQVWAVQATADGRDPFSTTPVGDATDGEVSLVASGPTVFFTQTGRRGGGVLLVTDEAQGPTGVALRTAPDDSQPDGPSTATTAVRSVPLTSASTGAGATTTRRGTTDTFTSPPTRVTTPGGTGSSTIKLVAVPSVQNLTQAAAEQQLTRSGFLPVIDFQDVDPGSGLVDKVISQQPAPGTQMASGAEIVVTVGRAGSTTLSSSTSTGRSTTSGTTVTTSSTTASSTATTSSTETETTSTSSATRTTPSVTPSSVVPKPVILTFSVVADSNGSCPGGAAKLLPYAASWTSSNAETSSLAVNGVTYDGKGKGTKTFCALKGAAVGLTIAGPGGKAFMSRTTP